MAPKHLLLFFSALLWAVPALAEELVIDMHRVTAEGVGEKVGSITAESSPYGVILRPDLKGLAPGPHGFHLHEVASCEPARKDGKMVPGGAAKGHFDPMKTGTHAGPYGQGHLGDLPVIFVEQDGTADVPVLAPRLRLYDLQGHAVIIHAGGDTYTDDPPLGGGGGRLACGVIK